MVLGDRNDQNVLRLRRRIAGLSAEALLLVVLGGTYAGEHHGPPVSLGEPALAHHVEQLPPSYPKLILCTATTRRWVLQVVLQVGRGD